MSGIQFQARKKKSVLSPSSSYLLENSFHSLPYEGPKPLPKRVLHRVRYSASPFNFHDPVISSRTSRGSLLLLPRLPITSIFLFFNIMFQKAFLDRMQLTVLPFLVFKVCRTFLSSSTICNTSFFTRSVQLIFSFLLQHHISKHP